MVNLYMKKTKEGDSFGRRYCSGERADRQSTEALQKKVWTFWNIEGVQETDILYKALGPQANEAHQSNKTCSEACIGTQLIESPPLKGGLFLREIL